jgi:hypothetical protein
MRKSRRQKNRQSRKKIANCDIGDRQRDPWSLWKGNLHKNKKYVNNPQTVFQKYSNVIEILQFFDFGQQSFFSVLYKFIKQALKSHWLYI